MAGYRLSPKAEEDLERIWFYGLDKWGLDAANSYIEELYQRFQEISEQPLLYQAVDDIRAGYRRSVFKSDSIFYRINGDIVEIMAVIGRQDLSEWL